jgi:hypothetical protein
MIATLTNEFDRIFVKLLVRGGWKNSPARISKRIQSFEATEDDSAWQLLHAASRLKDPRIKAQLFLQAMEEAHHAEIFRALYKQTSGTQLTKVSVERKPIYYGQEAWKLFAFFAVGEKSAARRFRSIADQLEDGPFRTSLTKILEEEEGHVEMANELTSVTGQSAKAIRQELMLVKLRRAGEAWLRLGRHLTSIISRVLLNIAYYTIGATIRTRSAK